MRLYCMSNSFFSPTVSCLQCSNKTTSPRSAFVPSCTHVSTSKMCQCRKLFFTTEVIILTDNDSVAREYLCSPTAAPSHARDSERQPEQEEEDSPQHRGTRSFCRGPGRVRLSEEESDLRSSAAPLRATLVRSTQEHHLEKDKAASGGLGEILGVYFYCI